MFSLGISGIFGLGPNSSALSSIISAPRLITRTGDGNFSATVFGGYLAMKPCSENFTHGMALSSNTALSDRGYLRLIQPDDSFFQGDIAWNTMQTFNDTSLNTDFYIELDS
ncbi:hypothetical protein EDD18DRAFT_1432712 [Armillaria luteobubalina]|uniref:Uncharacterized protein n=1 Tax=Armillaria luteobubalina TaxID=153913 RepID=A0AA39PFV7_9AGAR|nr:hypothetical protein EDD18DRAFT_1432712 [Armillaria luteobubalina]